MNLGVKATQVRAWEEEHSPKLSQVALEAAREHLTFKEAKTKDLIADNDAESNYNIARESHVEITLAYIKGKPTSLMRR